MGSPVRFPSFALRISFAIEGTGDRRTVAPGKNDHGFVLEAKLVDNRNEPAHEVVRVSSFPAYKAVFPSVSFPVQGRKGMWVVGQEHRVVDEKGPVLVTLNEMDQVFVDRIRA